MTRYEIDNKYIDLKINGRLFPSWINKNFKQYKLESVFNKSGVDPCANTINNNKNNNDNNNDSNGNLKKEIKRPLLYCLLSRVFNNYSLSTIIF